MAQKKFYLVARKDVLMKGRPVFYCRFRNAEGDLLPWRSTGETNKTRAELWALGLLRQDKERRENISLEAFVKNFWSPEGAFAQARSDHGFNLSKGYLEIAEGYTRKHLVPAWGACRLRELTLGKIDAWIVRLRHAACRLPLESPSLLPFKAGLLPWAHDVMMETKEHVFLFIPFLIFLTMSLTGKYRKGLVSDSGAKRAVLQLSVLIILLGLAMVAMGFMISTGARAGLEVR